MTLFGSPLHDLKLEDIQAFLDDADAEPLLWEAKATELRKGGVRKEVCGFANGHQTGYLILGASGTR
jgi:predicted HTH transcriptional regulator